MGASESSNQVTVLKPVSSLSFSDFVELIKYRDLFYFLVWRDIKVLYAQTILGFGWAILQPLIQIIIFTIIFGNVAKLDTGGIPYIVFSTVAIIPWTYMSVAMVSSSQSLVDNQHMLGKIYFPRLLFPITPILSKLVDFFISLLVIVGVFFFYDISPSASLLYLPLFLVMMVLVPLGVGLWLSALAIRYRDVAFAMQFVIRMLMYTAPIVYSAATIPEAYRMLYSINPIVGVIEGFRACLLGLPLEWEFIVPGMISSLVIFISGLFYFKRMERIFVDVI